MSRRGAPEETVMQVRFELGLFREPPQSEAEALLAVALGRPPGDGEYLPGRVRLEHSGQGEVAIDDDLQMLIVNLCARMPRMLADAGRAEVNLASYYQPYEFVDEAGTVRVLTEGAEVARYPRDELTAALRDCGRRFADFLDELSKLQPRWTGMRDVLREELAQPVTT